MVYRARVGGASRVSDNIVCFAVAQTEYRRRRHGTPGRQLQLASLTAAHLRISPHYFHFLVVAFPVFSPW